MANARIEKINAEMQGVLANLIKDKLSDPRLNGAIVSVLKVDTSNDLSHSNIYVSLFNAKDKDQAFKALLSSIPYLRRNVARQVKLRKMPELHFILDDSLDYADKINSLLAKIKKD